MRIGEHMTCTVETVAYGGLGIARVGGRVVFIPGTIPGETVSAVVTTLKKNYARASALHILSSSASRIEPCCRIPDPSTGISRPVPGCAYDHVHYGTELQIKQQQLESFLSRLPHGADTLFPPPFASPLPLHYRNKIVLHTGRRNGNAQLGYRIEPSHDILDLDACPLACGSINDELARLRSSDAFADLPPHADVTFRYTPHNGTVWWINRAEPLTPCGEYLTETSAVGPLRVPLRGFYQVNPEVANMLVRTAAKWFSEDADALEILDLYCGIGVFGLACMKAGGTRLVGVESGRDAVRAAQLNASALNIPAEFYSRALGQAPCHLGELLLDPHRTTCIVDPPREGLAPEVALALAASGVRRIFYIACDPATLARDLAILLRGGYRMTRACLFDMFPRTAHFESLVELRR